MKKNLLLLSASIFLLNIVQAQTSGGPDAYGYVWRDSNDPNGPIYNWVEISTLPEAVLVNGLADDNIVGPFSMNAHFIIIGMMFKISGSDLTVTLDLLMDK